MRECVRDSSRTGPQGPVTLNTLSNQRRSSEGPTTVAREPADIADQRRALGQRLAAFRQAAELTQGELARRVFRHRTTVVHVEKGRRSADAQFWAMVDAAVGANGVLVDAFSEIEAKKQAYEQRKRAADLADARR